MKFLFIIALLAFSMATQRNDRCDFCVGLVKDVELFLSSIATEKKIQMFLNNTLCPELKGPVRPFCFDIAANVPAIVTDLENRFTAAKICNGLHFCHNGTRVLNVA